jgi:moderate conductance mechanosensitive channel
MHSTLAPLPDIGHWARGSGLEIVLLLTGAILLTRRGRLDWERLCQSSVRIPVADAGVLVAARADAWALRRQFKE